MLSQINCRVNRPNQCTPVSLNRWDKGGSQSTKYKDIRFYNHGMQIYRPEDGLRVPQRRSFLSPEYFDSGCLRPYCQQKANCPAGTFSGPTQREEKMFDYYFESRDPYEGNNGPMNCVGIKGDSINSFAGWAVPPGENQTVWMLNAQAVGSCQ